jgi:type III pantothenate kinase
MKAHLKEPVLVLDIGNSETDWAVFSEHNIIARGACINSDILASGILPMIDLQKIITKIFIGSVNPPMNTILMDYFIKEYHLVPSVINHPLPASIAIDYQPVESIGIDRVADIVGAMSEYPAPLIVIDMGTALTFNVVSPEKVFIGGMITAGLKTAWDALVENTAQLPKLSLTVPPFELSLVSQSPATAIYSGFFLGYAAMIDGWVQDIRKTTGMESSAVIATGGLCKLIIPYTHTIQKIEPDLTLKGFYEIGLLMEES